MIFPAHSPFGLARPCPGFPARSILVRPLEHVMNSSNLIRITPRIMPRSVSDFCTGLFVVFPVQFLELFLVPWLIVFLFSHSRLAALIAPLLLMLVFIAFSVSSITLSSEGIRFHRLFGVPKFLPWSFISSIEIAPRWELITKEWLWPLLPAREMTASLTSLRHYRIS